MEEILASIRRIIAEDEQEIPSSGPATPQSLRPVPAMQDEPAPSEPAAPPAPSSGPGPIERPSEAATSGQRSTSDGLLAPATTAALDAAFNALAQTAQAPRGRTVEELVSELMRPMLKTWLDENLPAIVERLVRAEIERISRARD
jgi:uncharacterized protein